MAIAAEHREPMETCLSRLLQSTGTGQGPFHLSSAEVDCQPHGLPAPGTCMLHVIENGLLLEILPLGHLHQESWV